MYKCINIYIYIIYIIYIIICILYIYYIYIYLYIEREGQNETNYDLTKFQIIFTYLEFECGCLNVLEYLLL